MRISSNKRRERDVEMENSSFKESLQDVNAEKAQIKLAKEAMIGNIFSAIGKLNLKEKQKGPKLEDFIKEVAQQYQIQDTVKLEKSMRKKLLSGKYIFRLDHDGCIVTNYNHMTRKAMERDEELEKSAQEGRVKTIGIVKEIIEKIRPEQEVTRNNVLNYLEENYGIQDYEACRTWIVIIFDENMNERKQKEEEACL